MLGREARGTHDSRIFSKSCREQVDRAHVQTVGPRCDLGSCGPLEQIEHRLEPLGASCSQHEPRPIDHRAQAAELPFVPIAKREQPEVQAAGC